VLAHTAEGPEEGPGFGWGRECAGNARVEEAPQRYAYKRVPERIGARVAPRAVKGAVRRLDPVRRRKVPGRWGCNASSIKRKLAGTRHDGRRLGSFLHPLSGGRIAPHLPSGGDGGTILALWVNPVLHAPREVRGAVAAGRLGTDAVVPAGDNGRQRPGRFR